MKTVKRIHYAWWVCLGCAILFFCTCGLGANSFTIYQPYLLKTGLTNTQSSTLVTIRTLAIFITMLSTGRIFRKISLRSCMALAGLLLVLAFVTYGLSPGFPVYCVAALLMGLSYGLGTMIPIAIVLGRWFSRDLTLAVGIASAFSGLATLGIPSLLTMLVEKHGLRATFLLESLFILILIVISILLIRDEPGDMDLLPYGDGSREAEKEDPDHLDRGISKAEWFIVIPVMALLGIVTTVGFSHLSVNMNAIGYRPELIAVAITMLGISLIVTKLIYGWCSEHLGTYVINWPFFFALIAGLILCCVQKISTGILFGSMLLYGGGITLSTVGMTAWIKDWSSDDQYDRAIEWTQTAVFGGAFLFSTVPGILADHYNGSYRPAYLIFTVFAVIVMAVVQYLYIKKRRP